MTTSVLVHLSRRGDISPSSQPLHVSVAAQRGFAYFIPFTPSMMFYITSHGWTHRAVVLQMLSFPLRQQSSSTDRVNRAAVCCRHSTALYLLVEEHSPCPPPLHARVSCAGIIKPVHACEDEVEHVDLIISSRKLPADISRSER